MRVAVFFVIYYHTEYTLFGSVSGENAADGRRKRKHTRKIRRYGKVYIRVYFIDLRDYCGSMIFTFTGYMSDRVGMLQSMKSLPWNSLMTPCGNQSTAFCGSTVNQP